MCCPWWYPKFLPCIYLVLLAWIDIFRGIMRPLFMKCFSYSSYLVYASLLSWVALFDSCIYLHDLSVFLYWSFQMKSGLNKHYAALILLTVFLWPEEIWPHTLSRCSSLRSARLKCHRHLTPSPSQMCTSKPRRAVVVCEAAQWRWLLMRFKQCSNNFFFNFCRWWVGGVPGIAYR